MNKKDILIDFCIHLLLLGDEFHDNELQFFNTRSKNDSSYDNYVEVIKKFIKVEDFISDTDINDQVSQLKTLNNLITEEEIEYLKYYIKDEFYFGYPDEINEDGFACGNSFSLDLEIDDIKSYFTVYIELRSLNRFHYISYYEQFLNYLYWQRSSTIKGTKESIDNLHKSKNSFDTTIFARLKDDLKKEIEENLLKSVKKTVFQMQGGFDERGFIYNHQNTLELILNAHNLKYLNPNFELDSKYYYALTEYEYYQFKLEGKKSFSKTEKSKKLEEEFETLKKNNPKQIQFLREKKFTNNEIDIILNLFSINKYNTINIRPIRNLVKVDYYRLFHFFFRFEFLIKKCNTKFDSQNPFLNVPLNKEQKIIDKNQYLKYFKHSKDTFLEYKSCDKHYPFTKTSSNKLLEQIKLILEIDLDKLNIPSHLK